MADYFVSLTGNDGANGLTPATAWRTWGHAVSVAIAGDTVSFAPGTYHESVTLPNSGAPGNAIWLKQQAGTKGAVTLDGTGFGVALAMFAKSYITIEDIGITNDGGIPGISTQVIGLQIGSTSAGAASIGCHDIACINVHVFKVNHNARTDCLGTPVLVYSFADDAAGLATHHITFEGCLFENCLIERLDGVLTTGYVAISGNVHDWAVRDCTFDNTGIAPIVFGQGGIDTGGNLYATAKPNRPRKGVVLRSTFRNCTSTGLYFQGVYDMLGAQNVFINCVNGIIMATEIPGVIPPDYDILRRCWARDNLFINCSISTALGAFLAVTYDDISDAWVTNNTYWQAADSFPGLPIALHGENQTDPGKFGIIGNSRFWNNIVASPGRLMYSTLPAGSTMSLDYNDWKSDLATPFAWLSVPNLAFPYAGNEDQHGHFESFGAATWVGPLGDPLGYHLLSSSWAATHASGSRQPSWYTTGLFGDYDPISQYDVYGQVFDPASLSGGAALVMSKPQLAEVMRVGAPSASYDIKRVVADPRAAGLAADLGTVVEYVGANGSVNLQKYTTWDKGWRPFGGGPLYPKTGTEFANATKLTPSALYLNDQLTGNVFDASGNGVNLTVANTPTFQQTLENKVGIWYDGATDKHSAAAVGQPGVNSLVFGCEGALITDPGASGFNNFFGMSNVSANGYILYYNAGLNVIIRDAGAVGGLVATFGGSVLALTSNPRVPFLCTVQVDRAAGRIRGRMSRPGVTTVTFDVALGVIGNLSSGGELGFGSIPVFNGGAWVPYGFLAIGVQCEGANVLRDLAVGLGWEV